MSGQRALRVRRIATIGAVALGLTATTAPAALAGPGDWTQLSNFTNANRYPEASLLDQPTMARFGSTLQVVWPAATQSAGVNYFTALLDGAGHVTTPSTSIISGWSSLVGNPSLISLGGQHFLAFSGLHSTVTADPYAGGSEYYMTSPDGVSWTLGSGSLSATSSAYAAYGSDLVDNAGTPVWVGNPGSTTGVTWHSGVASTIPAPAGSDGRMLLAGCCAYSAAAARDAGTGAVYAAFYSNSNATSEQGIQVGQILPSPGAFSQAPGSIVLRDGAASSLDPGQRIAMAARPGGGVYVAYKVGYPTVTGIRVLQVGTANTLDVPGSKDAKAISLSADASGRLWVSWVISNRLKVAHTNTAASAFGAVGSWGAPRGTGTLWHTVSAAGNGALDVVVNAGGPGGKINFWHTQTLRTLSVKARPASAHRGGAVTFTVSDAGDPVAGASVRFGSRSGTTNGAGKVTITATSRGGVRATARKSGFNAGMTTVRVR